MLVVCCLPVDQDQGNAKSPIAGDYLGFSCRKDAQNANISSRLEEEQNSVAQLQKRLKELQVHSAYSESVRRCWVYGAGVGVVLPV